MAWARRHWVALVVGTVLFLVGLGIGASGSSSGSSKTVTVAGQAKTVTQPVTVVRTVAPKATAARALRGVDGQNLPPFTLDHDSTLVWSCPGCSTSNFVLNTDQDVPINSLNHAHGTSFLPAGRYTGVSVIATGPWTIRFR